MMISASEGGLAVTACSTPATARTLSVSSMGRSSLIQGDEKAAIGCRSPNALVTSSGKSYPPFKPALRYFQPVNDGRPERGRQDTGPRHQEIVIINNRFDVVRVHARQRYKDQYIDICFENIDRRFP